MKHLNELSIAILVDAKVEYTKELCSILVPQLYEGIAKLYGEAKQHETPMREFQSLLRNVPKWNQDIIDGEYEKIITKSKCDWLGDLITAVFISNTKILTAVRTVRKNRKINLQIPTTARFIHRCYIETAREFYKNPFLFDESENIHNRQRNLRDALKIIDASIKEAIRGLLPFKSIIKQYLGDTYKNDESTDIGESYNESFRENLKNIINKDLDASVLGESDVDYSSAYEDSEPSDNEESKEVEETKVVEDDEKRKVVENEPEEIEVDKNESEENKVVEQEENKVVNNESEESKIAENKQEENKIVDEKQEENKVVENEQEENKVVEEKQEESKIVENEKVIVVNGDSDNETLTNEDVKEIELSGGDYDEQYSEYLDNAYDADELDNIEVTGDGEITIPVGKSRLSDRKKKLEFFNDI